MRENLALLGSLFVLLIVLYFGLPKILPHKTFEVTEQKPSPAQDLILKKGTFSRSLMEKHSSKVLLKSEFLHDLPTNLPFSTIFPPDLIFERPPLKATKADEQIIVQAQRISLLENSLKALETKIELQKSVEAWSWEWGWEKLWAVLIWVSGIIFSTILKHKIEKCLKLA